jgi:hypothetical protein
LQIAVHTPVGQVSGEVGVLAPPQLERLDAARLVNVDH